MISIDPRFDAVAEALRQSKKILITTHVKSDGDGIGSELALFRTLKGQGKEALIVNDTVVPRSLQFLLSGEEEVSIFDPGIHAEFIRSADTIVVLDVGLTYRLGRMESSFLESKARKICIDHHLDIDSSFDLSLTEPGATSTGEILYGLLKRLDVPLTPEISTPLYTSISVDSGNFSYERCTPDTFQIASELVAAGASPYWIHLRLNWQRSMAEVKLDGEVIQRLRTDPSGEIAHSEVTQGMLRQYEIDPMEIPTLVNIPLSIEGVEIALLFVELQPCHIKVSARSKGKVQVCDLAKCFGGGGHPLASGFSIQRCLDEARTKVLGEARRLLGYSPKKCLQEV